MKSPLNVIHYMIEDYEKYNNEKPYIILVSSKTYANIKEELENSSVWEYLAKLGNDKEKINYIFGVPVEISHYTLQEAIAINKRNYEKYCYYKYMKDLESKGE